MTSHFENKNNDAIEMHSIEVSIVDISSEDEPAVNNTVSPTSITKIMRKEQNLGFGELLGLP